MSHDPEWIIHPRNANLSRTFSPLSGWSNLTLIERYNTPDTWWITGPPEEMAMFTPGTGSILQRDGVQVVSGRAIDIRRSAITDTEGQFKEYMVVTFASDNYPFAGRVVYPDPSFHLQNTISQFSASYDLRSGPIETLIRTYIQYQLGSLALIDRQLSRLRLPASLGRGGTTQVTGRLDSLGELIQKLGESGGLKVSVKHTEEPSGTWLDLVIEEVQDLSTNIRFGSPESLAGGIIGDWEWGISIPTCTRAIVGGGGEKSARQFVEIRDSTGAEALWGLAVEKFIDQRNVPVDSLDRLSELTRAGQDALKEGAGPKWFNFTPVLGPDLEYRRDLRVGDIVGYDLPGLAPSKDKIREAKTNVSVVQGQATETVEVTIGTPDAPQSRSQRQIAAAIRGITEVQRS